MLHFRSVLLDFQPVLLNFSHFVPVRLSGLSTVAKIIPVGSVSACGMRGEAFMEAVALITTNNDERPDPTLEDDVVKTVNILIF